MSRTHRCKDFYDVHNDSYDRRFRRRFGWHIESDYIRDLDAVEVDEEWVIVNKYAIGNFVVRPSTKTEVWKNLRRWFGESSHANERSPGKEYRNFRHRQNRRRDTSELHKFMKHEDYEPMNYEEPINCHWDWR